MVPRQAGRKTSPIVGPLVARSLAIVESFVVLLRCVVEKDQLCLNVSRPALGGAAGGIGNSRAPTVSSFLAETASPPHSSVSSYIVLRRMSFMCQAVTSYHLDSPHQTSEHKKRKAAEASPLSQEQDQIDTPVPIWLLLLRLARASHKSVPGAREFSHPRCRGRREKEKHQDRTICFLACISLPVSSQDRPSTAHMHDQGGEGTRPANLSHMAHGDMETPSPHRSRLQHNPVLCRS
jgi:hypothetical protein